LLLLLLGLGGHLGFSLSLPANLSGILQLFKMIEPILFLFTHSHELIVHGRKVLSDSQHIFIGRLVSFILVIRHSSDGIILQSFQLSFVLLLSPHIKLLTMKSLLQLVNLLQKADILLHDPGILSLLSFLVLAEVLAQML
jgi:hypothetical protein